MAADYAARCEAETDVDSLVAEFRTMITDVGFDASAAGAWVQNGALNVHRFYFNDWPRPWAETYETLMKLDTDLVVNEAGRRMRPFLLSDIREDPVLKRSSKRLLAALDDYGWCEVFAVPVHGPHGYNGLVALAAMRPIVLDAPARAALELIGTAVHCRCRETLDYGSTQPPIVRLTARQLECLRWVSAGKSDAATGEIIGISANTVHFHIEQAKQRLKVRSRAAAIAQALLSGQI